MFVIGKLSQLTVVKKFLSRNLFSGLPTPLCLWSFRIFATSWLVLWHYSHSDNPTREHGLSTQEWAYILILLYKIYNFFKKRQFRRMLWQFDILVCQWCCCITLTEGRNKLSCAKLLCALVSPNNQHWGLDQKKKITVDLWHFPVTS